MLTLLFLLGCHEVPSPKDDTAGHDLDSADASETGESAESGDSGCEPETEIPYDGIDQDCSGADLTDVDGDGHDSAVVGGDDCADADGDINPGASEIPYDGVDQDCSGADLTDVDGDGHNAMMVGGDDCVDTDGDIHPGAAEIPYDGIDQDCSGADSTDVDCDDHDAAAVGGDDCADTDADIHPGAAEIPYDGVDQDCSGADLTDVDGDGYEAAAVGGDDCADADGDIHPGASEIPYDGVDQDCSGADLTDVDGDGYEAVMRGGDDCLDTDAATYPGASEVPYDGTDQDCSGADLSDVDGDGHDAATVGGDDCLDSDASVHPGGPETPYDGVDQDCSGADLIDIDADGYTAAVVGGDDCQDGDPSIHPGASDIPYDGVDQDCSGADLADADGDGHDTSALGGDDCLDSNASIYPSAPETPYDDVDQDCSGADLTDVDGDGYPATVVGGDDCDDDDPTTYPGATEVKADGVDNDCDGRLDEYTTCWDGSGDFTTVQEGVDGTPDGGTLEICSGTYVEKISIIDREINVEGEDPTGVLISWNFDGDWSTTVEIDGASEVRLSSISLASGSACVGYYTVTPAVWVDMVNFAQCPTALTSSFSSAGATVERSYFQGSAYTYATLDGEVTFRQNIVNTNGGIYLFYPDFTGTINYSNNIVFGGGSVTIGAATYPSRTIIGNNTFSDLALLRIIEGLHYDDGDAPGGVVFTNNIFHNFRTVDGLENTLFEVDIDWSRHSPPDVSPAGGNNLFDDDGGALAEVDVWDYSTWQYVLDESLSAAAEAAMLVDGQRGDPQFTPGAMGSYSLMPSSPAIDRGTGIADPDGSPPDLGAFGGPDGNWWMEVPWPLP